MFTLLPEQHKKRLFKEYRIRLIIICLSFVSIFFMIGSALLFPSYISLRAEKMSYQSEVDVLSEQIKYKDATGLSSTVSEIKSNLLLAKPDDTYIYKAIDMITSSLTNQISITSLGYTRGDKSQSLINIQGVAKDRSSLIDFTNSLKKTLMFEKVDLPISNLAKQTDVPFNITLLGRF